MINASTLTSQFLVAITIPNNTATSAAATNLMALLRAAGYGGPDKCVIKIAKSQPAVATDRVEIMIAVPRPGAIIAATDFSNHGYVVAAGTEWFEPIDGGNQWHIRTTSGSTASILVVVNY